MLVMAVGSVLYGFGFGMFAFVNTTFLFNGQRRSAHALLDIRFAGFARCRGLRWLAHENAGRVGNCASRGQRLNNFTLSWEIAEA